MNINLLKKIRNRFTYQIGPYDEWHYWDYKNGENGIVYTTKDLIFIMAKNFIPKNILEQRLYDQF